MSDEDPIVTLAFTELGRQLEAHPVAGHKWDPKARELLRVEPEPEPRDPSKPPAAAQHSGPPEELIAQALDRGAADHSAAWCVAYRVMLQQRDRVKSRTDPSLPVASSLELIEATRAELPRMFKPRGNGHAAAFGWDPSR